MFDLVEATAMLAQTPRTLASLLADLPDSWITSAEGSGTWSARDVVAHLADLEETDWMPRVRSILEHGAGETFAPIDRVRFQDALGAASLPQLLDLFAVRRARNLRELSSLVIDTAQLRLEGTHPAFGCVTLGQLLATWTVHDLTHIAQIVRVMAKRYGDAVGPWSAYLSVLSDRMSSPSLMR